MYSLGLAMTLKPGGYPGYKKAHDELWPELAEIMHRSHVSMIIYRSGDRLFVHAAAPTEADWLNSRKGEAHDRWHELMKEFLVSDEKGSIAFELLETAFTFGDFTED